MASAMLSRTCSSPSGSPASTRAIAEVVQAQRGEVRALRRRAPARRRGASTGPGLLGVVGQGEDRALVERRVRERRRRRRAASRIRTARSRAVLGRVGLAGHEQVARDAHEAQPERDRVAEARVELAPRRCRRRTASRKRCGVVELPAVVVEHRGLLGAAPAAPRAARTASRCASAWRCEPARAASRAAPRADGEHACRRRRPRPRGASAARARGAPARAAPRRRPALSSRTRSHRAGCSRSRAAPARGGSRARRGAPSITPASSAAAQRARCCSPSSAVGQLGRDVRGHHRQALERLAAVRRRAARSRASTASLTLAGTSSRGAASVSVTKNGLPRVSACTAAGVAAGAAPPAPAPRARDSGDELEPVHRAAGERAEQPVQRVARIELVAHGQDEHRADRLDAARRVAEHVERGVVGPVDVLDDEHGRALLGELLQQRGEDASTGPSSASAAASGPSVPAAASCSGPSVRDATRSSHAAMSTRASAPDAPANARTRLVLPMPASPATSAVEPRPSPPSATAPTRTSSCASRSSRTSAMPTW